MSKIRVKLKIKSVLLILLLAIASCSTPLNRTYNPATYEEDVQEIRKSNKVSDEDLKAMATFILLSKLSGNDLSGKSYNDILEKVKSVQQSNSELSNRDAMEKDARRQRMSGFLIVNLAKKDFIKVANKETMVYTVTFNNISAQKIKTITGNLIVTDLIEKPVKTINILVDEDISPGYMLTKTYTTDYNHGDENDRRIRTKDLVDMRVVWDPEKIIFENGKMAE